MEDHLDTLLYLLIGILYAIFSASKKFITEESPGERLPPSTPAPAWQDDWDEEVEIVAPTQEEAVQAPLAPPILHAQAIPSIPSQDKPLAVSKQPSIERFLSRYKGWKRAVIISELLRPPT